MTLINFLLDRIADDEQSASVAAETGVWSRHRILSECEGKRRIVEFLAAMAGHEFGGPMQLDSLDLDHESTKILGLMASAYRRHPDFDSTWSM